MGVEYGMIIEFPAWKITRPAEMSAGRVTIIAGRCREALGRAMNALGVPGAIQSTTITDAVAGHEIEVSVSSLSVRLTVDGRDYYFDRVTGRHSGSGSGL